MRSANSFLSHTSITRNTNKILLFFNLLVFLILPSAVFAGWTIETIDSSGSVGQITSMAIDSNNKTHIVYFDSGTQIIKYATNASGLWVKSTIDNSAHISGSGLSIAVDKNNKVHVSYFATEVKYATNSSGSWVIETVDPVTGYSGSSIAIDANNHAHISYDAWNNNSTRDLKYASNFSGSWSTHTVDSVSNVYKPSTAIDSNDKVHICYGDEANHYLKYATNESGQWVVSIIDGNAWIRQSIAIDSNDKVHISYLGAGLQYATNQSGAWIITMIDHSDAIGWENSIAIDSNDKMHISYHGFVSRELRYATDVSGSWVISIVDSGTWAGSIAPDSNNKVHISYWGYSGKLKYATNLYDVILPRTGQTTSYATGDDGDIQAGVAWPSPRFTDNGDQTIMDNLTGLIWTKDAGVPTFGSCIGGAIVAWQAALDYVACLNSNNYLGYNDWRLPNINELSSITDRSAYNPALPTGYPFTNVQPGSVWYWSSTTEAEETNSAWVVGMWNGYQRTAVKDNSGNSGTYVWPVRAGQCGSSGNSVLCLWKTGQTTCYDTSGNVIACTGTGQDGDIQAGVAWPSPRFTDNGDQTVIDNLTGLMWTKDANAPGPVACNPGGTKAWQDALNYVACLNSNNYLGYNDWRLPNINELGSVVDRSVSNPALPSGNPFANIQSDQTYWSSTTYAIFTDWAWSVYMWRGSAGHGPSKGDFCFVWPIRGGIISAPSDTKAPVTTASPPGGTYSSAQNVTLTCNDGSGSGCASTTKYCVGAVGSGCTPTTPYTEAINISSSSDLRFYSTDNANNDESVKTETYTITPPTVNHTITVSAGSNGSITPSGSVSVNHNTTKTFTVTPDTGYQAVMSGTCGGNLNGSTYTTNPITADCTVIASFNPTGSDQDLSPGNNVQVSVPVPLPSGRVVLVEFDQVVTGGTLNVTVSDSPPGGGPPTGFKFLGTYYDVSFTGTFSGYIYITLPYKGSSIPSGKEKNLKIFHWKNGWEDCTFLLDKENNEITGRVTSLSPFGIGYSTASSGSGSSGSKYSTGANENMIAAIAILALLCGIFIMRKRRGLI